MAALTFFFCGTGSNSFDFSNGNFFQGELVSTLAMNHMGHEFVDWAIVDGPGSGNMQESEKWVMSGDYSFLRGTLTGAGWEENVQHALRIAIGRTAMGRTKHTKKELKMLHKHGVGVETVPGRFWGTRQKEVPLGPRIAPQHLQAKKVEIMGQSKTYTHINCIGWSRGGVTCHMFANAAATFPGLENMPINIFACDPVPGLGNFQKHRILLGPNVRSYVSVISVDERSRGFSAVIPSIPASAEKLILAMPGRHGTLVGNASTDGDGGPNRLFGPGNVTRDLAEKFLTRWGTPLKNRLTLGDAEILTYYDAMLANKPTYEEMHNISYTAFTQKGDRVLGMGDGTWRDLSTVNALHPDLYFVNKHHRGLFAQRYTALYNHIFSGRPMDNQRKELEFFNLRGMYPNLAKRLMH